MIQRVQSIYFLLSIVATIAGFFLPLVSYVGLESESVACLYGYGLMTVDEAMLKCPWGIVILSIAIMRQLMVSLLAYKNRIRQIKQTNIALVLLWMLVITIATYSYAYTDNATGSIAPSYGLALPFLAIFFATLARKYVKKDEELVRAADRIR